MTPDELRPILTAYRKQVEQGWSKATAPSRTHCWLQMNWGWDRVVIDVTADQVPALADVPITCQTYRSAIDRQLRYVLHDQLDYQDVLLDPVMDRLAILTKALS